MSTTTQNVSGIVGIFDALGAKNFDQSQVSQYIELHKQILKELKKKISDQTESRGLLKSEVFTFNDTIIIAVETDATNQYNSIKGFAKIVRWFISYSLSKGLFFRGAFSIGALPLAIHYN